MFSDALENISGISTILTNFPQWHQAKHWDGPSSCLPILVMYISKIRRKRKPYSFRYFPQPQFTSLACLHCFTEIRPVSLTDSNKDLKSILSNYYLSFHHHILIYCSSWKIWKHRLQVEINEEERREKDRQQNKTTYLLDVNNIICSITRLVEIKQVFPLLVICLHRACSSS